MPKAINVLPGFDAAKAIARGLAVKTIAYGLGDAYLGQERIPLPCPFTYGLMLGIDYAIQKQQTSEKWRDISVTDWIDAIQFVTGFTNKRILDILLNEKFDMDATKPAASEIIKIIRFLKTKASTR